MKEKIKLKVKTLSNLMIGGTPAPFEIGGVDQYTATTYEGEPYIPASSLKGALREIVHDDCGEKAQNIAKLYEDYLNKEKKEHWDEIKNNYNEVVQKRMEERYHKMAKPEFLFGIEGFNNSPKLMVNDLYLCEDFKDKSKYFSIDAKTAIKNDNGEIISKPRIYKAARNGLVFEGEIFFYKIDLLGKDALKLCKDYIIEKLEEFNEGIYRIGNSKSRGYGRIEVTIEKESGVS